MTDITSSSCKYFDSIAVGYDSNNETIPTFAYILAGLHLKHTKNGSKNSLLDFGCGTGIMLEAFNNMGFTDLHGIDGSEEMLNQAITKVNGYVPATSLHHHDFSHAKWDGGGKKFDHITMQAVFPFISNISMLFENLSEVMNTEGILSFNFREDKEGFETEKDEYGNFWVNAYHRTRCKFYLRNLDEFSDILNQNFSILEVFRFNFIKEDNPVSGIIVIAKKK